ncbi:hypothetical protein ACIPY3_02660 [Paenarthrobacter sp. NPDC089714]|uniref:hypothetical protein n=1 Tax=Paenarthrobacter sp. NPDC089714 TaxID=3364377 RepID=UPI0038133C73
MAWNVYTVSTDTWGNRVKLPAASLKGGRTLNKMADGSASFQISDSKVARLVTPDVVEPLERALVFDWDGTPIYAGLILDSEHDVDGGTISVSSVDIWWLFQFRHVLGMHGAGAEKIKLTYSGLSLATIAKKVIQEGSDAAPLARYQLPIVWEADLAGTESREYEGYKFTSVADALQELMSSEGGPDLDFPPRWNSGKLELVMRSGDLTQGRVDWDATVAKSEVIGLKSKKSAAKVSNKVIGTGEGSGEDLLVKAAESFAGANYPAIERVVSYSGISKVDQLAARARADLATANTPTRQVTFKVPVDGSVKVPSLTLGGLVRLNTKGVWYIPDGWTNYRMISYAFDLKEITPQLQLLGS